MCSERETEQASEREGDSQTCIVSDYAKVEHERALSVLLESGAQQHRDECYCVILGSCISGTFRAK